MCCFAQDAIQFFQNEATLTSGPLSEQAMEVAQKKLARLEVAIQVCDCLYEMHVLALDVILAGILEEGDLQAVISYVSQTGAILGMAT